MTTHSSAAPPRGSPFILLLAREYRNRPWPDCLGGQAGTGRQLHQLARPHSADRGSREKAGVEHDHRQVIGLHRGQRRAPGRRAGIVRRLDEGSIPRPAGRGPDLRGRGFDVVADCLCVPGAELPDSQVTAQFAEADLEQRILAVPARGQALPHHVLICLGQRLARRDMPSRKFTELVVPGTAVSQRFGPAGADAVHELRHVRADDLHQEQAASGAAMLFAWRDYMPTFTDTSLIAAGAGALLWAVLAIEASPLRRTGCGLAGFVALEVATFVRYTDIVVLGCAAVAGAVAWRTREARLPTAALVWWLGSVALSGAGVAVFDDLVYGGPLKSGYRQGEITFSLSAVLPNLRYMPAHLIKAMPVLVLGLAGLGWITWRWARLRRADGEHAARARRDLAVGLALTASWFSVWGLYAAYTWTAHPGGGTLQVARFYVPALGAIALLGAWLLVQLGTWHPLRARRAPLALISAALVMGMFGLGAWSFTAMRNSPLGGIKVEHGGRPALLPAGGSARNPGPGGRPGGGS
jgi:hypothetical protein